MTGNGYKLADVPAQSLKVPYVPPTRAVKARDGEIAPHQGGQGVEEVPRITDHSPGPLAAPFALKQSPDESGEEKAQFVRDKTDQVLPQFSNHIKEVLHV